MGTFLARRLLQMLLQVFVAATVIFFLVRLVPGNPAVAVLGDNATEDQIQRITAQMGLDKPVWDQYLTYLGNVVRGDLGVSLISGRDVATDIRLRIGNTLELAIISVLISLIVGMPLGILAALRANRAPDVVISSSAALGLALPSFVVGTVLILIFGLKLGWLPQSRFVEFRDDPVQHIKQIILPVATLSASAIAVVMRMTRSSMLEVVRQDYIRTARAKGLIEKTVVLRHALRNAINPVVSIIGLELAALLGGTVIVETIFNWPGLSSLLMSGVRSRDYPVIQGVVLLICVLTILINLLVDIAYGLLDPLIRYE
ncbi:MAG: ABC transporter permease [Thermomicrobiales bacterium]